MNYRILVTTFVHFFVVPRSWTSPVKSCDDIPRGGDTHTYKWMYGQSVFSPIWNVNYDRADAGHFFWDITTHQTVGKIILLIIRPARISWNGLLSPEREISTQLYGVKMWTYVFFCRLILIAHGRLIFMKGYGIMRCLVSSPCAYVTWFTSSQSSPSESFDHRSLEDLP